MQVNLKKGLALRKKIEANLNERFPTSATISVYDEKAAISITNAIADTSPKLDKTIEKMVRLSSILCDIRIKIAKANVECGIEELLAKKSNAERQISILKRVTDSETMSSESILKGKFDQMKKSLANENQYMRNEEMSVSLVSQEMVNNAEVEIRRLRRQIEVIEDDRMTLNQTTSIEIAEDTANFLIEEGFI